MVTTSGVPRPVPSSLASKPSARREWAMATPLVPPIPSLRSGGERSSSAVKSRPALA